MKPREKRETGQNDFFRARLDQIVDMSHLLVKLAAAIDWGFLNQRSTSRQRPFDVRPTVPNPDTLPFLPAAKAPHSRSPRLPYVR